MKNFLMLCVLMCCANAAWADDAANLISNGDLEAVADGGPVDWKLGSGATWEKEGDNHFLRLKTPQPGQEVLVYRAVVLKPEIKALWLTFKVRYEGIERGKQNWFDGRIMMNFKDAQKETVNPGPGAPSFHGTVAQWKEQTQQFKVPDGAKTLEMMFTLFNAKAGQLDFDDVRLIAIPADVINAEEAEKAAKEAARIAASRSPSRRWRFPAPTSSRRSCTLPGMRFRLLPANRFGSRALRFQAWNGLAGESMCLSRSGWRSRSGR